MQFEKLDALQEQIGRTVVASAIKIHLDLGPGLLEKIYEVCLTHELRKAGFRVRRQVEIPIKYDGIVFDEGLRLDLLVDECIIIEVKAVDTVNPVWQAQVLSHLKLTGFRLGFLINFNVPLMKEGIRRFVL
ncbi:GxxExxY protein [Pseudochryseolinea flava]|uniref:GxxExxY protein n=1 Tax=Pseudochryseolinea flava TaxID=2059302 RepID=A0A364Y7D4_9BACT|nr:GxxExxY protein [Pseudochryseolinea flava]RAW02981.1 GxxExxY protein [Pseudochryseolinea flava]